MIDIVSTNKKFLYNKKAGSDGSASFFVIFIPLSATILSKPLHTVQRQQRRI